MTNIRIATDITGHLRAAQEARATTRRLPKARRPRCRRARIIMRLQHTITDVRLTDWRTRRMAGPKNF